MSVPSFAAIESLRQVIADTLTIDVQDLRERIGALVVASSAECPGAAPDALSLHDDATRTTVLLADRIPAGQEPQALAAEIARWHGKDAAQEVIGERLGGC